jgi:hypothetical protein
LSVTAIHKGESYLKAILISRHVGQHVEDTYQTKVIADATIWKCYSLKLHRTTDEERLDYIETKIGETKVEEDPIQAYFTRYPNFEYDPTAPPARLFDRLVQQNNWPIGSPRFEKALSQVRAALFQQFDSSIEIPGPMVVEPEPQAVAIPAEQQTSSAIKAGKGANRRRRKAKAKAEQAKLAQGQGVSAHSTPGQNRVKVEVDAEETGSALPKLLFTEARTDSSPIPQQAAHIHVDTVVVADEHCAEPILAPASVHANPEHVPKRGDGKTAANATGSVVGDVFVSGNKLTSYVRGFEGGSANASPEATQNISPLPSPSIGDESDSIALAAAVAESANDGPTPLDVFFNEYPDFNSKRDRTLSVATQFNQLRKQEKWWGPRHGSYVEALKKYQEALVLQFDAAYGTDGENLETWHRIMRAVGAQTPDTVPECKAVSERRPTCEGVFIDNGLEPHGAH